MGKRIIKLTESQLRDIVQKVITQKILNEQEATPAAPVETGEVSLNDLAKIAADIDYWMNGDVTTEYLNKISNELKTKVFGKTSEGGGCAMNKIIGYYEKSSGIGTWAKWFTALPGDGSRSNLLKDIESSGEAFEIQFEDVKKQLIAAINGELNGYCKQQSAPQDAERRQKSISKMYCSVVNGVVPEQGGTPFDDGYDITATAFAKYKWTDVVTAFKITPEELRKAYEACWQSENGKIETTRIYAETMCSVVNGKITMDRPGAPGGGSWKDHPIEEYMKIVTGAHTPEEVKAFYAAAKVSCPDNQYVKTGGTTGGKSQFVKNNGFPLKYMQMTERAGLIGKMQVALGMGGDGYFGNKTNAALTNRNIGYDPKVGVSEEMYNQIISNPVQQTPQQNIMFGRDMKTVYDMNDPKQKEAYLNQAFQPTKPAVKPLGGVNTQLTPQQQADMDRIKNRPAYGTPTAPEDYKNPGTENPY